MCILYNFSSIKARFSHSSTVIRLHSCSGKKYADDLRASCFYKEINIFEHFLKQDIQQKNNSVSYSVLLGACPQPCSMRADMLYYYILIKEESRYAILLYSYKRRNFKMFLRQIYIRIFTKTHQIVPLFKNFHEGTCPLNIQYAERSNYLLRLQYNYVYISKEKF